MNFTEAKASWLADKARFEALGAITPDVVAYMPTEWKRDYRLAMDAQPALATTPNSAIPSMLTTLIDPDVYKVLFSPTAGAQILGEVRKGTWIDDTAMFPTVEYTGEVSSYDDFAENGRSGANANWPQRQSYLFMTNKEYGDRELERAGLARLNWVSELDQAAANNLNRFANLTYFFGVEGLQNYGLLNDPNLSASISPGVKAAGNGNVWVYNDEVNGTANEIYADCQSLFIKLVAQTGGLVNARDKLVLALSPTSAVALTATNLYNVNVYDLLRKNFPNIRFEDQGVQYGAVSPSNPQGVQGGSMVQLIAESIDGQKTGYAAFNEKMRAHRIVPGTSSFKQKVTGGTWGAVIRMPVGIASMIGV